MKKAFDQTVRDLKREVNKKVLKVPGIEQKVLDATSNEPWGPHGSLLADIAQATRNYQEYQIIMHVIWKRLNDTGKNWRHVYKALTVLEYLVGHGSERVIDDIREHAYQISTLSDFQYIDSSGKDQGSNVKRKSQSLVALVNDKEKIQEVRQKALVNKDKYRSTFATGGRSSYSGSGSYGDRYDEDRSEGRYKDGYEGRYRDDDRSGNGREREWGSTGDERFGKGSDPYNRDGDRYGRDDDYRGGRGNGDSQFVPRSRSFDGDRDRFSEEDDRYASRRPEPKLSEQSPPPSYEETVKATHEHVQDQRSVENVTPSATKVYSPPAQHPYQAAVGVSGSVSNKEVDEFDGFDPRGSIPAIPAPASGSGVDLFGDQSASIPIHSLALVPVDFATTSELEAPVNSGVGANFVHLSSASTVSSQPSEDPFGDGPFRAASQANFQAQQHGYAPETMAHSFDFGDALGGLTYTPNTANGHQYFASNPPSMGNEFLVGPVHNGATPSGPSVLTAQTAHSTASGTQPAKDKFETKSMVWSDTLNRGLVNLNISGAKVNPLADIGVDFEAINRMDKRKERSSAAAPVTSTITMGKAMGSGSGIGRAAGMGMGMGMGMNQPMGMGMGMGMGMNQPMGMGMGMNQGVQMRPPGQGPGMGMGGYGNQQPYVSGYR